MILFRYLGTHAYETLKEARLKTSRVRDLNDPFEFRYSPQTNLTSTQSTRQIENRLLDPIFQSRLLAAFPGSSSDELRELVTRPQVVEALRQSQPDLAERGLEEMLNSADTTIRLICFSSEGILPSSDILLWSHYAAKHQGHRIGFEIPVSPRNEYRIDPVTYSKDRIKVHFTGDPRDLRTLDALCTSTGTKFDAWQYEEEYRLTTHPSRCDPDEVIGKPAWFSPIEPAWVVRVDCGLRSDLKEDRRILALVKERYHRTSVYKAQFHPTDYSIKYELIHKSE